MPRFTIISVCLLIAASVAVTVSIERRTNQRRLAQTELLNQQAAQIAQLSADNARLSNVVVQTAPAPGLSAPDLAELLQLRNEAGQLRKLAGEKARLEATNAALRDLAEKSKQTLARVRTLPNYWPKDQLAYAGYADPPATVKSLLAAMKNADLEALKNCFDPAIAPRLDAELNQEGADPAQRRAEIKTMMTDFLSQADGFHIIDQTVTASNQVAINLSFDGAGRTEQLSLRKIGDTWKISDGP